MGKLKIVYPICCGMDVHRDFLIACIASINAQGVMEYQSRRFSTYTGSLRELRDWLTAHSCRDVCMESTGKYWFPIHNILGIPDCASFLSVFFPLMALTNFGWWIADLFKHDLVRGSFIPPKDIRQLRDLCRYWVKLSSYMTGEKNRAQKTLAASRSEKHPEIYGKKQALQKRRGKKKAIVAIARKILTAILNKSEPYNPSACVKEDKPPVVRQISQHKAFALLVSMGYIVSISPPPLPA